MQYRREIDGLRAVAVAFVIIFHFFPHQFPLGFLGVDLFFVISGYVIAAQIQKQMLEGTFKFNKFYARRIKRILPLTFLVLTVSVAVGAIILLKSDFEKLVDSVFATATFWANIFFWRDGGYFGSSDKLKPLLHMWSLAVEEQFYVFFPLFLWLLIVSLRLRPIVLLVSVFLLVALSLAAYLGLRQIGGTSPAFFLMPTRAWQFGIGVLAALLVSNNWNRTSNLLSVLSLLTILSSFFVTASIFPSEIIISFGVALYLVTTRGVFIVDKALSSRLLTYVGIRSFSLYLWHWPIVAFSGYVFVEGIPLEWKFVGLALTFMLSEMSFLLVEKPFRYRFALSASFGLIASCVGLLIGLSAFSSMRKLDNLVEALAAQNQTNYRCQITDFVPYGASRACIISESDTFRNVAILGNSHAQMYTPAIQAAYSGTDQGIILIPLNGCLPTTNTNISVACLESALINLTAVLDDDSISTVFIGTTYGHDILVRADGSEVQDHEGLHLANALFDLIEILDSDQKNAYLIGPIQTPGYELASDLARSLKFGQISRERAIEALRVDRSIFDDQFLQLVNILKANLGLRFLQASNELCNFESCLLGDTEGSFFADSNHLSRHGVERISPIFDVLDN